MNIKGPTVYTVTSLARDPETGTLFYTTDNRSFRDLVTLDPVTRKTTLLQRDARIGDLAFNTVDKSIWGIRQLSGLCTLVRIAPPYRDWKQVHTFPYGTVVYDLDVSPDGSRLAASFGEIDGRQNVRVLSVGRAGQGRRHASRAIRLRHCRPERLRVLAERPLPVRQLVLHRHLQHLSLRDCDRNGRRRDERGDRVLPADSARRATS